MEDNISIDDKVQKIENDDDSIKFSSRSLELESSSSSSSSLSPSSSNENFAKQKIIKSECPKGKNWFQRSTKKKKVDDHQ